MTMTQLTLDFRPGLTAQYRSLRETIRGRKPHLFGAVQ